MKKVPKTREELTLHIKEIEKDPINRKKRPSVRQLQYALERLVELSRLDADAIHAEHAGALKEIHDSVIINRTRVLSLADHRKILAAYRFYIYDPGTRKR
ncbi:MAG: hypothetical protein V1811_01255 [Candidatus Micrarchaeota archaeon]